VCLAEYLFGLRCYLVDCAVLVCGV